MPSNHLILCRPLLLSPSIFPSIRVFSSESALRIRWPKYWSLVGCSPWWCKELDMTERLKWTESIYLYHPSHISRANFQWSHKNHINNWGLNIIFSFHSKPRSKQLFLMVNWQSNKQFFLQTCIYIPWTHCNHILELCMKKYKFVSKDSLTLVLLFSQLNLPNRLWDSVINVTQ